MILGPIPCPLLHGQKLHERNHHFISFTAIESNFTANMVELKPSSSTTPQPKPEYGHLSEIDPEFAPLRAELDKNFAVLWSLPLDEFKTAWLTAPLVLPDGAPMPDQDYEVADQQIPMRDGAEVELRVYRPMKRTENATLVLKAHGGGWVVGSHQVEEVENRTMAAHCGVVVASVDYRMAPEYKFPYAVNDCFDALKWVDSACCDVYIEASNTSQCKSNASSLGINPESIIVAGGSAGGNIVSHPTPLQDIAHNLQAAVLALKARDEKVSGIIGQILNIPVTCHPDVFPKDKYEYGSYDQNKDASVVDAPKMNWFWEQYMPKIVPDAYAHPLLAKSHAELPPARELCYIEIVVPC